MTGNGSFHSRTIPDPRLLGTVMGTYAFFVCALALAGFTFRAIEVPGIRYGRKVIKKMRGTAPQTDGK